MDIQTRIRAELTRLSTAQLEQVVERTEFLVNMGAAMGEKLDTHTHVLRLGRDELARRELDGNTEKGE